MMSKRKKLRKARRLLAQSKHMEQAAMDACKAAMDALSAAKDLHVARNALVVAPDIANETLAKVSKELITAADNCIATAEESKHTASIAMAASKQWFAMANNLLSAVDENVEPMNKAT